MSDKKRVALLVETSTSWGTGVVRGVAAYARQHGPWFFYHEPRGRYEKLRMPKGFTADGIIARVTSSTMATALLDTDVPIVNVSTYGSAQYGIPQCSVDERQVGQMAAQHFLERAFLNYAYYGPNNRPHYDDVVYKSYRQHLNEAGYECTPFLRTSGQGSAMPWEEKIAALSHWLAELPKPVAVLAWSAINGRQVTEACQYAGIRVPEEIAVLGGENDELMSVVSDPPLSDIDLRSVEVGERAAQLLNDIMQGAKPPSEPILLDPAGIVVRRSSDTLATSDVLLNEAVTFMRDHATSGISVADVVRNVPISRRVLEERFASTFNRSPAAEIRRIRIEHAKQILADSDASIPRIAMLSGFGSPESLSRAFRRMVGITPIEYRKGLSRR